MLTKEGEVKVLDFGLAKLRLLPRETTVTGAPTETMTADGQVVGTYPYMSPEQIRAGPVDHRSDIFSLGVILHELAAGVRPFQGRTAGELMSSILKDVPASATDVRPEIPALLPRVIRRCLEKEPSRRYQSALDVRNELDDLKREFEPEPASKGHPVAAALEDRKARRRWLTLSLAGAALLTLAVLLAFGPLRERFVGKPSPQIQSLAVLPLDNLMGNASQDFFVEGMHDALISELAKTGLKVISRTTVMRYRKTDKSIPQIARELGVDALIEGSVLRVGDDVRVTAQLIDGTTDEHIWANSYHRDLANAMAMLAEVTRAIASQVRLALTPQQQERLARARPVNPEAQDAYLRGRHALFRATGAEAARNSIGFFEKALEIDPDFASAHSGLAYAHCMTRILSGAFGDPEGLRFIRTHANKSLDLDPGLADGHALLGVLSLYADWDWTHAEKELKLAIELNPSDAVLYHPYADSLLVQGRVDESVTVIRKGVALDPLSPMVAFPLAFHLCLARRFDEAIEEGRGFQKEFPGAAVGRTFLRYALWYKGAHEEAVEEYRSGWRNNPDLLKVFEQGLAKAGPRGAMRAVAQLLDSRSSSEKVSAMGVAGFYARAGDVDSAMKWLERAYKEREVMMPHVRLDPDYDVLHSDPRFQDLLRRMNFPK